jgi:methylphosphotriester-DNA--protein-cysteine methyltransferase
MYDTDSARYLALQRRDPLATSAFVYCVKTTGIYCRPDCRARLARRSNVEFCDTSAEAEQAGYRACKRCRPELESWDPVGKVVQRACASIRRARAQGRRIELKELAEEAGMTKCHFLRLFKKHTGVTPGAWAAAAPRGDIGDRAPEPGQDPAAIQHLAAGQLSSAKGGDILSDFDFGDMDFGDVDVEALDLAMFQHDVIPLLREDADVPCGGAADFDTGMEISAWLVPTPATPGTITIPLSPAAAPSLSEPSSAPTPDSVNGTGLFIQDMQSHVLRQLD